MFNATSNLGYDCPDFIGAELNTCGYCLRIELFLFPLLMWEWRFKYASFTPTVIEALRYFRLQLPTLDIRMIVSKERVKL